MRLAKTAHLVRIENNSVDNISVTWKLSWLDTATPITRLFALQSFFVGLLKRVEIPFITVDGSEISGGLHARYKKIVDNWRCKKHAYLVDLTYLFIIKSYALWHGSQTVETLYEIGLGFVVKNYSETANEHCRRVVSSLQFWVVSKYTR